MKKAILCMYRLSSTHNDFYIYNGSKIYFTLILWDKIFSKYFNNSTFSVGEWVLVQNKRVIARCHRLGAIAPMQQFVSQHGSASAIA